MLHPAFMYCCSNLRTQLEQAVAAAAQRPDSLGAFVTWHAVLQQYAQARPTASRGNDAQSFPAIGCSSAPGAAALKNGLLMEVEAMRMLLDVLRCAVEALHAGQTSQSKTPSC